jgi:hypothetical protein
MIFIKPHNSRQNSCFFNLIFNFLLLKVALNTINQTNSTIYNFLIKYLFSNLINIKTNYPLKIYSFTIRNLLHLNPLKQNTSFITINSLIKILIQIHKYLYVVIQNTIIRTWRLVNTKSMFQHNNIEIDEITCNSTFVLTP